MQDTMVETNTLLQETFDRISSYLDQSQQSDSPVVTYASPKKLRQLVDFGISVEGTGHAEFTYLMDQYLAYAVNTGNRQFLNQLYAGFNLPAFIGDLLTTITNTSMYTYEVAPVATLIETEMVKLMCAYAGYEHGDGIFTSGGSNGNLLALFSARNHIAPQSRFDGYDHKLNLVGFVNEEAHYSFDTAANLIGIGSKNMVRVKTDASGRMDTVALEEAIESAKAKGKTPFFVAATCGTTVRGAYDPIRPIAAIAKKHSLWLHADGSFGGSIILSKEHRHLMQGIELTDSFVWNPHKLMNIPLICSVFLVNNKKTLRSNLTDLNTNYIFHENDDTEDLGVKSIQCGRRVDAVKLWFAWKYYGLDGYAKRIDQLMQMASYAESLVKAHPRLELLAQRHSFTICFRYLPENTDDLNAFNLAVRDYMRKQGLSLVNFSYLGRDMCIRLVTANAALEAKDIDAFFRHFVEAAEKIDEKR